jgi:hypothetical protein
MMSPMRTLVKFIEGSNAVISAFNAGWTNPALYDDFLKGPWYIKGVYQIGGDNPVFDENGKSIISVEDLAIAIVDELERPVVHNRQRFTVAY